jgi:hypothetical protein
MSPQSNGDRQLDLGAGLLPPSVADCMAFAPKSEPEEGESSVGNIAREASGNKIT